MPGYPARPFCVFPVSVPGIYSGLLAINGLLVGLLNQLVALSLNVIQEPFMLGANHGVAQCYTRSLSSCINYETYRVYPVCKKVHFKLCLSLHGN